MENNRYRISEIKLSLNESVDEIPNKIKEKKGKWIDILNWEIVKESIDARKKSDIRLIYTVDFETSCQLKLPLAKKEEIIYSNNKVKSINEEERPVIIGFGPAGMFAALALAEMGLKPIILERGKMAEERAKDVKLFFEEGILNTESNVQFGEGGAGTFSDGKLTTGIKDKRIQVVLNQLYQAGASKEILYKQKPHVGTDVLIKVVKNIRENILKLGGDIRFNSKATKILVEEDSVSGVEYVNEGKSFILKTNHLIMATGQSAVDSYKMMEKIGMELGQKPFSMGVRVVHPQKMIDKAQYGNEKLAIKLGAAEYKLSHKGKNGRGVYTFCMCPGGEVIMASSGEGEVVTNGMSNSRRNSPYANSAVLVDVRVDDFGSPDPLAGLAYRNKFEKKAYEISGKAYKPLRSTWGEFKKKENIFAEALPTFVIEGIQEAIPEFGKKIADFDSEDIIFLGIESRSSSPVRVFRDENKESNIKGIYPAGEGAGAAGGITSAAVDGLKIAENIRKSFE